MSIPIHEIRIKNILSVLRINFKYSFRIFKAIFLCYRQHDVHWNRSVSEMTITKLKVRNISLILLQTSTSCCYLYFHLYYYDSLYFIEVS